MTTPQNVPAEYQRVHTICKATDGQIRGKPQLVVDARELWTGLEVGKDFSTWIKDRFAETGAVESQDYEKIDHSLLPKKGEQKRNGRGGHNAIEYRLSLILAKRISMMQGGTIGGIVQGYYIWCETVAASANHEASWLMAELDRRDQATIKLFETMIQSAIWAMSGVQAGQAANLAKRHDHHDNDLTMIGVTCLDTKDVLDLKPIKVILAERNIHTDRHFSNRCSASLRDFCSERGVLTTRSKESRAHVFPESSIGPWLQVHGNDLIKAHLAGQKIQAARQRKDKRTEERNAAIGQTNLFTFPPGGKKPA